MSPEGVPVFYGSLDRPTCVAETRPALGDQEVRVLDVIVVILVVEVQHRLQAPRDTYQVAADRLPVSVDGSQVFGAVIVRHALHGADGGIQIHRESDDAELPKPNLLEQANPVLDESWMVSNPIESPLMTFALIRV
jgi:hypothetical protein